MFIIGSLVFNTLSFLCLFILFSHSFEIIFEFLLDKMPFLFRIHFTSGKEAEKVRSLV